MDLNEETLGQLADTQTEAGNLYDASKIKVLEGLEAVDRLGDLPREIRERPAPLAFPAAGAITRVRPRDENLAVSPSAAALAASRPGVP